jgi:hypothetical protein
MDWSFERAVLQVLKWLLVILLVAGFRLEAGFRRWRQLWVRDARVNRGGEVPVVG